MISLVFIVISLLKVGYRGGGGARDSEVAMSEIQRLSRRLESTSRKRELYSATGHCVKTLKGV